MYGNLSSDFCCCISADMPQTPGIYDKSGKFHFVPEMVPEFVVPDLSDFKVGLLLWFIVFYFCLYNTVFHHTLDNINQVNLIKTL